MSRKKLLMLCIILVGVLTISTIVVTPIPMAHAQDHLKRFYVRSYSMVPTVTAAKDGLSWEEAFADLQTALEAAEAALTSDEAPVDRVEIWVAAGTYMPTSANGLIGATVEGQDDRYNHFQLLNNVAIYGGFPENGGTWDQRDWENNITVLSGDIGTQGDATDNSYHVFYNRYLNDTAILDGFTVTAGNANGQDDTHFFGGGFYNYYSSPLIRNVKINGNHAYGGGGIYNEASSNPLLINVTFENNTADDGGGGMFNNNSYPCLNNVVFTDNQAVYCGGGVYNESGSLYRSGTGEATVLNGNSTIEFTDVEFAGNQAHSGGGVCNRNTNLSLNHAIFTENVAEFGGGMYNVNSYCLLSDVEFNTNTAIVGGGVLTDSGISVLPSEFSNVVFLDNTATFWGGGMGNLNGVLSLNGVTFIANSACYGGAIANEGCLDVNDATFFGNRASVEESGYGGGIWHCYRTLNLVNAVFSCNSASAGGGIYSAGDFNLLNATFSGNDAHVGGALYFDNMDYGNKAANETYTTNSLENEYRANIINCIFWANTAQEVGSQIFNAAALEIGLRIDNTERDLTISNSLIEDSFSPGWDDMLGTNAGGNINADPLFIRNPDPDGEIPDYGDLRLQAKSPARDKGTNTPYQTGIGAGITHDLAGKPRISNARVDMGAYEFQYVSPSPKTPTVTPEAERLGGKDRFETAVEISKAGWKQSEIIVLARNDIYADALAGVPLAYLHDSPLLLTRTDSLPPVTRMEIRRLGATKAIILGGVDAISQAVRQELQAMNLTVQRVGGSNRFATAAMIAHLVAPDGVAEIALANGYDFPDPLSVAAYAARKKMPVLLTDRDVIPSETKAALAELEADNTIVIGGTDVISELSLRGIGEYLRIFGNDRYETAVALANHFNPAGKKIFIATGLDFADSLTGAALAAKEGCGLLLLSNTVPKVVADYLADKDVVHFTVLGGEKAVSENLIEQLLK